MMSLRRLAIIAPLTLKHNKQNTSNIANSMANMAALINAQETTETVTNIDTKQTKSATAIAATPTTFATVTNSHRIIDDDSYADDSNDNSKDDSNETYTNIINAYTPGNGLQTLRASFGLSGLIGHNSGGIGSGGIIGGSHQTYPHAINGNANLLLCGAMLSVVTTVLCVVCYCCHRNIKKRTEAAYRQQHQWLESDPNMEIYSVEQSYDTSGIFLGESSDAFTTLATLHHEPPPSYDAVVALQEQQLLQQQLYQQQFQLLQQQTHLQHNSPPPGYRSTLAVNEMPTSTMSASAATSNLAMDQIRNDSNGNLSGSCNISISGNSIGGNSCSNFFACGKPTALTNNRYSSSNNSNNAAFLNMKKVLNAQSCCSLQRAEVENMWNAATAAVAARASRGATSSPCGAASLRDGNVAGGSSNNNCESNANRNHISPMLLARKSLPLPLTLPAKFTMKAGGRRYLPHHSNYYRRGCPLCGKFRYDADEALTLSVESELNVPTNFSALPAGESTTEMAASAENAFDVARNSSALRLADRCHQLTAMNDADKHNNEGLQGKTVTNALAADAINLEKCACSVDILESSSTVIIDSDTTNEVAASDNNNVSAVSKEMMIDKNANGHISTVAVSKLAAENASTDDVDAVSRPNGASINEFGTAYSHMMDAAGSNLPEDNTLDAINANTGIIRVDMSKVIDQTGLPTYEAAEKLESSGYV